MLILWAAGGVAVEKKACLEMAQFLKRLGCLVGRHSPSRRSVHYAGHLKVGPCKYCGADLEKGADGRWAKRRDVSIREED